MKVLVSDKIAEDGVKLLTEKGYDVIEAWDEPKDKLPELIKDCDAIIVRSATKVRKELIDAAPKLKVIGRAGVGLDNVDVDYAKEKGIKVVNTPAATTISVAELTIAFMFALSRYIVKGTDSLRKNEWIKKELKGTELFGKTLGIVGMGRIGREVAKRAICLGMKVIGYDPYIKSVDIDGVVLTSLDEVLSNANIVTLHMPLTEETKHLINKDSIEKMKKGAILINCARGGIVDEDALYDALSSGKLRMAALDVFETEPPKDNKLLELDNFICTPHIGGQTIEGQIRAGVQVAENVISALRE